MPLARPSENGFYYDFDAPFSFTQEHLDALEAEMKKICKEKLLLERFELPRAEATSSWKSAKNRTKSS